MHYYYFVIYEIFFQNFDLLFLYQVVRKKLYDRRAVKRLPQRERGRRPTPRAEVGEECTTWHMPTKGNEGGRSMPSVRIRMGVPPGKGGMTGIRKRNSGGKRGKPREKRLEKQPCRKAVLCLWVRHQGGEGGRARRLRRARKGGRIRRERRRGQRSRGGAQRRNGRHAPAADPDARHADRRLSYAASEKKPLHRQGPGGQASALSDSSAAAGMRKL